MNREGRFGLPASILLLSLLLAGCIELHPVAAPPAQPTVLQLSVEVPDAAANPEADVIRLGVSAALTPGIDGVGRMRVVEDDTLRVGGAALAPSELRARGQRFYRGEVLVERRMLLEQGLRVHPPSLRGVEPVPVRVRWPVLTRVGEPELTVGAGAGAPLRTVAPPASGAPPESQRWSVTVNRSGAWSGTGQEGRPPGEVMLVPALLGGPGGPVLAILYATQSGSFDLAGPDYQLRLDLAQTVRWWITIGDGDAD
jgi:hypothetical protein